MLPARGNEQARDGSYRDTVYSGPFLAAPVSCSDKEARYYSGYVITPFVCHWWPTTWTVTKVLVLDACWDDYYFKTQDTYNTRRSFTVTRRAARKRNRPSPTLQEHENEGSIIDEGECSGEETHQKVENQMVSNGKAEAGEHGL